MDYVTQVCGPHELQATLDRWARPDLNIRLISVLKGGIEEKNGHSSYSHIALTLIGIVEKPSDTPKQLGLSQAVEDLPSSPVGTGRRAKRG